MPRELVTDDLWNIVEPLLPPVKPRRHRYPGRKPITHRQALTGIVFVLATGMRWNDLPAEMNCGSGVSCWRRMKQWEELGVWDKIHAAILTSLGEKKR